jgi:hypothetical protein
LDNPEASGSARLAGKEALPHEELHSDFISEGAGRVAGNLEVIGSSIGLIPKNALVLIESINSGMVGNRFGEVGAVGGGYLPRLMAAMKT